MKRKFLLPGAFFGATAVILGAFAAHGLKATLDDDQLRIFHTGVEYQFYHALAILIVGLVAVRIQSRLADWSAVLFIIGIVLFSGSLFLLAINPAMTWIGIVTPFGGLSFIGGWICLIALSLRKPET